MRLTNTMRDGIIAAILADTPATNIEALARGEAVDAAVATLPPKVRAIWKDSELAVYLNIERVYTECAGIGVAVPASRDSDHRRRNSEILGAEGWAKLQERCGELRKLREDRASLKTRLEALFATVTTDKAFREAFPDFAAYCPEPDSAPITTLPATIDLVEGLRAAGWKQPEPVA